MPDEKEKDEAPRIPGAFRPGDPVPEQPKPKTVDDEADHDKAREAEATAVDPMKSTDLGGNHHKAKATHHR